MVALSCSTSRTVMPLQVWPSLTVFGSPPSSASTAALRPITPTSAMSAAPALPQARTIRTAIKFLLMKPVAIFRASLTEGPGYFASYLDRKGLAWQTLKLDAGEAVPRDARKYSGLVFMGGPMSVNDDLPGIARALE